MIRNQLLIIGSINMDIVNRVERHPQPGETIKGLKTEFNPGGKGANQAVAAARAGGKVSIAGALGKDPFSADLKAALIESGINTKFVTEKDGKSGLAFITVDNKGENFIILEEGANGKLTEEDVSIVFKKFILDETIVLLQNEIPWNTTQFIINKAFEQKVPVYFNPAPALEVPHEVLAKLNGIFVNELEAEIITGVKVTEKNTARRAAGIFINAGVQEVIITMGEKGACFADSEGTFIYIAAEKVKAVDTTAAGDTFIGAYLAARMEGRDTEASLHYANSAAGISVTKEGAQQSIPDKESILKEAGME